MAKKTVADHLIERLLAWGVHRIYGYPGDGINGIMGALQRAGGDPAFVQSRHEEMSAFMATGHAKFAGGNAPADGEQAAGLGVCLATSGPGAIHLLNGLYDARLDHAPVLAIVGQQAMTALGGSYQQEVDLANLFKDVAGSYVQMVGAAEQLPNVVDRAVRIALTERTVTCLIFPTDIQGARAVDETPHEFKMVPGGMGFAWPRVVPPDEEVRRAADVLNEGERVAILVGQGARNAADQVIEVADHTGAGVAKALLGKDVLPDDLPFVTGSIGLLGTRPSWEMMMGCDTLLMVGSSTPYSQFLPEFGQARSIEIDIDPRMIGLRYPNEVNLVGDAAATLDTLIPMLERKVERSWREKIEADVVGWWELMEERAMLAADPVNPQRVFWELSPKLPDNCIVTADSGSATNWYARDLKFRAGMRGSLSGTLATMGSGVPYAIAAKFVHPDRPVVACVGDGAMQMNGMAELITISRYWREWDDPRLIVLVLHNNDLNQVTWEMRAMEGDPKYDASQAIPDVSYAGFAESVGLRGITVDSADQIEKSWDVALGSDRPVVVDAIVDPEVPPLPPHIEWEQASAIFSALMKGDPESRHLVRQAFKEELVGWLPGKG